MESQVDLFLATSVKSFIRFTSQFGIQKTSQRGFSVDFFLVVSAVNFSGDPLKNVSAFS